MKVLLLGKGQLGWELQRTLQPLGEVVAFDYPEVNMADEGSIRTVVREHRPNVIINATAYTAVDKAESDSEIGIAYAVNATGPGILAEEARSINALVVHYSTDYVFDGTKGSTYTEEDTPNPLNVYGKSKLAGEQAIQQVGGTYIILRTAWVYSMSAASFVGKVLQWSRQNETLKVVSDQVSNPTWARGLAETTALMLARPGLGVKVGLYHLAGHGHASRFEWAQRIVENDPKRHEQTIRAVEPAKTDDFPTPAQRPLFSALNCESFEKTFGLYLPAWQDALKLAME